jgi:hypothetical protein
MRPDNAHMILLSGVTGPASATIIETAGRARAAVSARPSEVDQNQLVTDVPAELDAHIRTLRASPAAQAIHAEGWQVALVDLTRVCAFQPVIFSDQAVERVQSVDADDLASIAAVTLPLIQGDPLPVQYDPLKQVWTVVSSNLNLRIVGNAVAPVDAGGTALGFAVVAGPSFMQVGRYRGRHFLRDGYHRAFGLLSRGITVVPAFVRDITAFEELVPDPRTMLPQDSYSGNQPPILPDYLNDEVSTAVLVPAVHKMIIIQALELTPVG